MEWLSGDNQTVGAASNAVTCPFGQGVALFDVRANLYYSLNKVGAFIWYFIQEPKSVSEICDAVCARYKVDRARCRADVDALLAGLAKANLIRLHDEELV